MLYIGVTNDIRTRLSQHTGDAETERKHFTGQYNVLYLIYYERFAHIDDAIAREKQLKGWTRKKKEWLINKQNPNWDFLNEELW